MQSCHGSRLVAKESGRPAVSLIELARMFPNDAAAERWFIEGRWPGGKVLCPRCNKPTVDRSTLHTMQYRCTIRRRFFSVRTGTAMEGSNML